jgi:hypothetical protein
MYEKMIQIDPNAPTEEEHQAKGVTKPRYMVRSDYSFHYFISDLQSDVSIRFGGRQYQVQPILDFELKELKKTK